MWVVWSTMVDGPRFLLVAIRRMPRAMAFGAVGQQCPTKPLLAVSFGAMCLSVQCDVLSLCVTPSWSGGAVRMVWSTIGDE